MTYRHELLKWFYSNLPSQALPGFYMPYTWLWDTAMAYGTGWDGQEEIQYGLVDSYVCTQCLKKVGVSVIP